MKKVLIIISIFSLSIAGTGYMAYDFDETEKAVETNLETRRLALKELKNG